MRAPITESEISMTATDRLARAIGLYHPLSEEDREQIIDAGLADRDDFEVITPPWAREGDAPLYGYCGDRWTVEFRGGRPHLVASIEVPPNAALSEVARSEHRFALVLDMVERAWSRHMTDEKVAEVRGDIGWAGLFEKSARRDREEADRDDDRGSGNQQDDRPDARDEDSDEKD